ncbi:MAG TPA: monovalent cation/H+ antiporter complex subunit F [Nocardioidaceae bacterium]|nr:monovalent cation/H+ antiporter complex subunit F [Nocardioidaceae bacterium]
MSTAEVTAAVVVVLLSLAGLGATWRIVYGPTILDRMVASEVLLVVVMIAILADMALRQHTTNLPLVLVLAALAFTGSVTVSRYVSSRMRRDEQ